MGNDGFSVPVAQVARQVCEAVSAQAVVEAALKGAAWDRPE